MQHPALRFLLAALLSAIAAVVVATLSLPLFSALGSDAINGAGDAGAGFGAQLVGTLVLLIAAIPIGGTLALPTALVMGGAMLWLTARAPHLDRAWVWALAAVLGSIPAMFVVGGAYDIYPDRILLWVWLALAAIVGALVFRWWWRRGLVPSRS